MKKTIMSVILSSFTLAGCVTANTLGVSNQQWQQYDSKQRSQMINNYQQNKKILEQAQENKQLGQGVLAVNVQGGEVMMSPFEQLQSYRPVNFQIREGECAKTITVYNANLTQKANMLACYKDKILYLDPSRYDVNFVYGSVSFPYLPIWQHKFTYPNITSTGYLRFTHANVTIRKIN